MKFLDFMNGLFAFLTVSICFVMGLLMIIKYFQYKKKELFFIGFAWMAIYQPWWPSAFALLLYLFGFPIAELPPSLYFLIANMFIPVTFVSWFIGVTNLFFTDLKDIRKRIKRYAIIIIMGSITIIMDIIIVISVTVDYKILGTIDSNFLSADYSLFMSLYLMFVNISVAISGILMGYESLKTMSKEMHIKGIFLIIASVCYVLGGLLDVGFIKGFPEIVFVSRSILISCGIIFYFGFFLPDPIKKILLTE